MQETRVAKQWQAEGYHKHSRVQHRWATELLARYSFYGNEKVLDVGCGDGKITAEIATKLPHGSVTGIDKSDDMIFFAKQSYGNCHNLKFERQDATGLPYQNQFDLVFSCACLQWVKDQISALRGISSSLCSGGLFLAIIPNPARLDKAIKETSERSRWRDYFLTHIEPCTVYEAEQYVIYLEQVGLAPVFVSSKEDTMLFEDKNQLFQWLLQVLDLEKLPLNFHKAFIEEMIDTLISHYPQGFKESGAVHIPMSLLEIEARK
jgi:trans-aconitate 2-methyltransferase